jgi:glutathione peroxidase
MDRPKPIKKTRESRLQAAMSKKKKSKRAMHSALMDDPEEMELLPKAAGAGAGFHAFTMKDIDGKPVKLGLYKGKVLLVVNVASLCGNTPQYGGLQALYEKYKEQGLVVLGFPSNDFGKEEPGSDAEIKQFCSSKYQVSFPLFSKIDVIGRNIHPLYRHLCDEGELPGPVTWNFEKFLVGRDGEMLGRFTPDTQPEDPELCEAIEEALETV